MSGVMHPVPQSLILPQGHGEVHILMYVFSQKKKNSVAISPQANYTE
jgi:hypothetical protein